MYQIFYKWATLLRREILLKAASGEEKLNDKFNAKK